jgi:RNA polymerase primary sigma factor
MAKKVIDKKPKKNQAKHSLKEDHHADVLARYMSEISKIKPLLREEETALAIQVKKSNTKAMQELVRRNLKYVITVANKFKGCGLSLQDLIEEGNIGLIQAAKRFDGDRNVKFITYAVWWIRQAIMHALAEQAGTVRLPIKQAGKLYKINRKYKTMSQILEREPTPTEVASGLGLQEDDMETVMRAYRTHVSLDTPLRDGDDTPYIELLENPNYIPYDDQIIQKAVNEQIDVLLKDLDPREEQVLRMRFGFDCDSKTLEEIGQIEGLSRERIRQIEKRAKARLKAKFKPALSAEN